MIFTEEQVKAYWHTAEASQSPLTAMTDMLNLHTKHIQPDNTKMSVAMVETIRDILAPILVQASIEYAVIEKQIKMPAYAGSAIEMQAQLGINKEAKLRIGAVIHRILAIEVEIDLNVFSKVDFEGGLMLLAINPSAMAQYSQDITTELLSMPVIVNGERITN